MQRIIPSHDLLWLVLDSLRFDVAEQQFGQGQTPNLARLIALGGWERRHTPGNFTFAAHQAFFAGFWPTPTDPAADRERLFAARFGGSETTGGNTYVFDEATVIEGLRSRGYFTLCFGGVGFFNKQTEIGTVLTRPFDKSIWRTEFGVTCRESTRHQFEAVAAEILVARREQPLLCFINVSALHQPNYFYARESGPDDLASHAAALRAVDAELPVLMSAFVRRGRPLFHVTCSDHGTAYGESGFTGHRISLPCVMEVPYAHGAVNLDEWEDR